MLPLIIIYTRTYLFPLDPVNNRKHFASLNCQCIFELKLVYARQSCKPFVPVSGTDKVDDVSMREALYVIWHTAMPSQRGEMFYQVQHGRVAAYTPR
jgi:hypothetical protein